MIIYKSIIGNIKIVCVEGVVTEISMTDECVTKIDEYSQTIIKQLDEYFLGERKKFTFPFVLTGTEFQKKVYNEVLKISYAQTNTYKDIAKKINNVLAVRAVGNANKKNKLLFVVPCHRVIGSNNKLVGYSGGIDVKKNYLKWRLKMDLINKTFRYVEEVLKDEYSGHDINHIKRVYKIGCDILKKVECDELVVKLALILHDIDDYKITKIKLDDCVKARSFLEKINFNKVNEVCEIINKMSFSKNKEKKYELSIEGQIVQDADRIDAIGAVGVARTFQYGGKNNRDMQESFQHFDDKLIKLYDLLNTQSAKDIAFERHEFLISFYKQFKKEFFPIV